MMTLCNHFGNRILFAMSSYGKPIHLSVYMALLYQECQKGFFRHTLSDDKIAYTNAACSLELDWLGYCIDKRLNIMETINNLKDHGVNVSQNLLANFSFQEINFDMKIKSLCKFKDLFQSRQRLMDGEL